jgi:hypothetical protein
MKKILIFLSLTIGLMWSVAFVLLPKIESRIDEMTVVASTGSTREEVIQKEPISTQEEKKINNKEIVRQKIEAIRKRLALKWLIIEWDSYYRDWQLPLALKKYLDFYKQNPNDTLIVRKLGGTYFEMKKFSSAYDYYSKITDESNDIEDKTAESLVLMTKLTDATSLEKTQENLKNIWLSSEQLYYYSTSLTCLRDFHDCKKDFWSYFWPEEEHTSSSWSGSQRQEISYKKLERIKNAIVNYKNFQVDDVYLKDAYIIWAWYSNGFYNLSAHMWEQLLKEKLDYKPILKIVAQSYFELGKYEQSRNTLLAYYEIDDEDPWVAYLLWVVNSKLREYVLANIYLSKALNLGYNNGSEIHRKLIHNFYLLENDESMLESFNSLIATDNFTQNDLSLWIYYHIIHEKYEIALSWAKQWKELFWTDTPHFHTYEWWILTERWEYEEAQSVLQEWFEIDGENPFVLINFWYNALARWSKWEALIYFKKIIHLSPNSEFAENAKQEIEKLSKK